MRQVTITERRALLVRRHRLDGSGSDPEDVVRSMVALHATDPASVYLSVLARSSSSTIADVSAALYDRRSLMRWMAMRRTLFVFARDDIPVVHAAVSTPLAAALRRQLLARIERNGVDPPIETDLPAWFADVEDRVEDLVRRAGSITGTRLRALEPALQSRIRARTRSEAPQALTSPLITMMSTEGRLVRGAPTGAWTTRNHHWETADAWWPDGIPTADPAEAQSQLARRWLERFGPATTDDLRWWTGWNKTTTRNALSRLDIEEVDLHGEPGIDLRDATGHAPHNPPVAALLPALDPTPMGWKHRRWFTATDPALLYDRAGNIGPTLWWNGEIVGAWSIGDQGIRLAITVDHGRETSSALEDTANQMERRLTATIVTPAARTPLERQLAGFTRRRPR